MNSKISVSQFGFLKRHSALQQLLVMLHLIHNSMKVDVIYMDFRKAFDSVPHVELLLKLWKIGFVGNIWMWFKAYLFDRSQCVKVNGTTSDVLPVISGVPQGSILGPLMFLLYVNDLPLTALLSTILMFADDTKCISTNGGCSNLQKDIYAISGWSKQWRLGFNVKKFVHLCFSKNQEDIHSYHVEGSIIPTKNSHRDLGVIISANLDWKDHYQHLTASAYRMLGLLRRHFSIKNSVEAKKTLYISIIRSRLTYCSPLWRPDLITYINQLENVQRRATKYILGDYSSDYKSRLIK